MKMGKVMGVNGNAINIPDLNDATNALNSAKDEFIKTINDKSKWAALFLFGVSFFLFG